MLVFLSRTAKLLHMRVRSGGLAAVYAPDTRIKVHPVKFGSGEWTSVIGEMEGTFTKPMPAGGGKTIAPTGKAFKLPMCTVGRWKNGVMVEEYLFWDNRT